MKKIIKILGLFIFTMFICATYSNAAISASSSTVNSGEEATISITSDVAVGSYSVTLTDLGGTTFVTSSGGTGAGTQTVTDAKNEGMTSLATFKVKVPEVTTDTTYSVSFSATAMEDVNLNAVADSTATASITVKAPVVEEPVVLSTNANLRNLGITPNDFTGFKSGITSYNVEVPYDTEKVTIYAYVADEGKATVSGTGSKSLSVGENEFNVVVTAEDGTTTKTYTLTIKRQTEEETNATNSTTVTTDDVDVTLSKLEIEGLTLTPSFNSGTYIYSAKLTKDVDELDVTATPTDSSVTVTIEGNENLKSGENKISIKLTDSSGETADYTVTVTKTVEESGGLTTLEVEALELSPSFDPDIYSYVATLTEDLSKLDVKALRADGSSDGIEVTGNDDIQVGENTITILVYDEENDETLTYQIILTKELQDDDSDTVNTNGITIGKYIIIAAAIIILIALIILLKPKKKKKIAEENDDSNDNFNDDNFNPFNKKETAENNSEEIATNESNSAKDENMDKTQVISNLKEETQYNLSDEQKSLDETDVKQDRSKEYNVFNDKDLIDDKSNVIIQDEFTPEDSYEIEKRKNYLRGKPKGKHF